MIGYSGYLWLGEELSQTLWCKITIYNVSDSVGQEFRSSPAGMPRLCSTMSRPYLEDLKAQGNSATESWNHLKACSGGWWLVLAVGWDLNWDFWPEYLYVASPDRFGFLTIWWLDSCARERGESHTAFYNSFLGCVVSHL